MVHLRWVPDGWLIVEIRLPFQMLVVPAHSIWHPSSGLSQRPSNGSFVAHYAKESSKQIVSGIVTFGDIGYKKLSKCCSELITDSNVTVKHGTSSFKANGTINGYTPDLDNVGMVIVRDIVLRSVVVQFRARRSPIAALCFDPSGTLLVTASISSHNINVIQDGLPFSSLGMPILCMVAPGQMHH